MAKNRGDGPVTLSLLDRLIDDPNLKDAFVERSKSLRALKQAVRRDLEWLLNTRHPVITAPEGTEVHNSLYMYGLPDITSMTAERLKESIKTAVAKFEPRLENVTVKPGEAGDKKASSLGFVIEGMLRMDPSPEQVSFDTVLERSSGEFKVQGEAGAR